MLEVRGFIKVLTVLNGSFIRSSIHSSHEDFRVCSLFVLRWINNTNQFTSRDLFLMRMIHSFFSLPHPLLTFYATFLVSSLHETQFESILTTDRQSAQNCSPIKTCWVKMIVLLLLLRIHLLLLSTWLFQLSLSKFQMNQTKLYQFQSGKDIES